jgi:hypothetical protein
MPEGHTLRAYWAIWLHYHLGKTIRSGPPAAIEWQVELVRSRLL